MEKIKILLCCFYIIVSPSFVFCEGSKEEPTVKEEQKSSQELRQQMSAQREAMVKNQIKSRSISDPEVLVAMETVPRHLFIPQGQRKHAYEDRPLPIGEGQTISQPYIVAYMTEKLNLEQGDNVLEIGTGSGYQAAVLSEITKNVYTIEIIDTLAQRAQETFEKTEYTNITAKNGDGYYGWEKYAPFDAIIVTAAAGHIPPPLMQQLKKGGRMIIPVGGTYEIQHLILVRKDEKGNVNTKQLLPVRFVPLTGDHGNR